MHADFALIFFTCPNPVLLVPDFGQVGQHEDCMYQLNRIYFKETALSRDLSNKKKGPMFGIPVSVKECYYLKGYDCTGGMAYYLDKPVKEDNVLIQVCTLRQTSQGR